MNNIQKRILDTQKQDPLSVAEILTGKSYKDDDETGMLGLALHIQKGAAMRDLIALADDTQFSSSVKDYLRIVGKVGFEVVLKDEFEIDGRKEFFYILFQGELGIVISFDTFSLYHDEPFVNDGRMYYNYSPNNLNRRGGLLSSGGYYFPVKDGHIGLFEPDMITPYFIPNYPESPEWGDGMAWTEFKAIEEPISQHQTQLVEKAIFEGKRVLWSGHHDCREAIVTTMKALWENGKFFPKWHNPPFLWFVHYGETKVDDYDYKAITEERISRLPDKVRGRIIVS